MSFYRMSAFGASAPELFPGGPTFVGGDDQGVFYGANTGFTSGAKNQGYLWIPAELSLRTKAGNKWAELSAPEVSSKDSAWKEGMQRKLNTLLQSFYAAVGNHSALGYSADATQQVINVGDQLKAALRQIIAYRVTPDVLEESLPAPSSSSSAPDSALPVNRGSIDYPSTTSGALTVAQSEALAAGAAGGSDSMKWILIAGAGAVAVLGAVLLLRRRPAAVSGYRRRRRRR